MSESIKSVKGTRDYYPEEMAVRNWLYQIIRQVSESFGYQEFEGPILESFNLYAAKSSEEIVEKQSYVFTDRAGDKLTLRPELTPTLARMVAKKQPQLTFPLRWWSFGPFWRYERPQKGRTREFFQWNIDMIGDPSPEADAELVIIAATFLKKIGLNSTEVKILINNRQLMDAEMTALGIGDKLKAGVYHLIDRKAKMKPEAWLENAEEIGLSDSQIANLEKLLQDFELWKKSDELTRVLELVSAYGLEDFVQFDPKIIRGLVYYTGTVFEAWDTEGDFRSLFGGGRYDDLVSAVGGKPVEAVGFAVGDLVISLLLKKLDKLPALQEHPAEIFITVFDLEHLKHSIVLGKELRGDGFNVLNHLKIEKLGKQFKFADRSEAKFVLIIGPEEVSKNEVSVKILNSGEQFIINRDSLSSELSKLLEGDKPS